MIYKITEEQLKEILDDAWFDGYDKRRGEYQVTRGDTYVRETLKNIVKEYKVVVE